MAEVYRENFSMLTDPASDPASRYQAVIQIEEAVMSSDRVAGLAAKDMNTFVQILRSSSGKSEEQNIQVVMFKVVMALSRVGGHSEYIRNSGLLELCIDMVNSERFRIQVLAMLHDLLDKNPDLVGKLVKLGVIDVFFRYANISDLQARIHVLHGLSLIAAKEEWIPLLLQKGVCPVLFRHALNMDTLIDNEEIIVALQMSGLDLIIHLAVLALKDEKEKYELVMDNFKKSGILDKLVMLIQLDYLNISHMTMRTLILIAARLHNAMEDEQRAVIVYATVEKAAHKHPVIRSTALSLLTSLTYYKENVEIIVNSDIFNMCSIVGIESSGEILNKAIHLLFLASAKPQSAKELARHPSSPKVLVKIIKDNDYEIKTGESWDRGTTALCLLTLCNLALYADNPSESLESAGAIPILRRFKDRVDVVGMLSTMGLAYTYGGDELNPLSRDIPHVTEQVFEMILETLDASLLEKSCHGNIIWSVEEMIYVIRCLSVSMHNHDVIEKAIPQIVNVLSEVKDQVDHTEAMASVVGTLLNLSYTKSCMHSIRELGPAFVDLIIHTMDFLAQVDREPEAIMDIEALLLSMETEEQLDSAIDSKQRRKSSGLRWSLVGDPKRLASVLKKVKPNPDKFTKKAKK